MSADVVLREVRHALNGSGDATTGSLLLSLRGRGYVGTVGYLTQQLHQAPDLERDPGGRWSVVTPAQDGSRCRPSRKGNGAYGLHRCAHVGRCRCPQVPTLLD